MTLLDALASALFSSGLCAPFLTLSFARDARPGLAMMMELWTAGGLLRLSFEPGWLTILAAAALVAVRKLTVLALRRAS